MVARYWLGHVNLPMFRGIRKTPSLTNRRIPGHGNAVSRAILVSSPLDARDGKMRDRALKTRFPMR